MSKFYREYSFNRGITVKPRLEICGTAQAMGDAVIFKGKVFDIFQKGKLIETVETWQEVLQFVDKQPKQTTAQALEGYDYLRENSKRVKRPEENIK
jgi:hypothetical protein